MNPVLPQSSLPIPCTYSKPPSPPHTLVSESRSRIGWLTKILFRFSISSGWLRRIISDIQDIKNNQIQVKWFLGCSLSCVRSLISDISSLEVNKIILKLIYKYVSPGLEAVQHWSQRQTVKPPDFEHLFPIYKFWKWIIIAFLGQIMPKFLHKL